MDAGLFEKLDAGLIEKCNVSDKDLASLGYRYSQTVVGGDE